MIDPNVAPSIFIIPCQNQSVRRKSRETSRGHGIEDRILVDAVDAMQVGDVARLPEMLDAQRLHVTG